MQKPQLRPTTRCTKPTRTTGAQTPCLTWRDTEKSSVQPILLRNRYVKSGGTIILAPSTTVKRRGQRTWSRRDAAISAEASPESRDFKNHPHLWGETTTSLPSSWTAVRYFRSP